MINAKGLMNTPETQPVSGSVLQSPGTPGGLNICPQKCLLLLNRITKKEITPSTSVKAIFPVTFAEPGINPKMLLIRIKKKTVKQVRHVFLIIMAKVWLCHIITHKNDHGFYGVLKPVGALLSANSRSDTFCNTDHDEHKQWSMPISICTTLRVRERSYTFTDGSITPFR